MNAFNDQVSLACSICWGSDGATLDAANAAVLFMLVLLVGVFGSFLSFIFYLKRRSQMVANEADLISAFSQDFDDDDSADGPIGSQSSVARPAKKESELAMPVSR